MLTRICIVGNATLNGGGGGGSRGRRDNIQRPKHMKVINLPMANTHLLNRKERIHVHVHVQAKKTRKRCTGKKLRGKHLSE